MITLHLLFSTHLLWTARLNLVEIGQCFRLESEIDFWRFGFIMFTVGAHGCA